MMANFCIHRCPEPFKYRFSVSGDNEELDTIAQFFRRIRQSITTDKYLANVLVLLRLSEVLSHASIILGVAGVDRVALRKDLLWNP